MVIGVGAPSQVPLALLVAAERDDTDSMPEVKRRGTSQQSLDSLRVTRR